MSVSFTYTDAQVKNVRTAVALWATGSVDGFMWEAVKSVAEWQAEGATAKDVAAILSTPERKVSERTVQQPMFHMVRLYALVKDHEDVTGVTACGVLLQGTGRDVQKPATVLKDWTKSGRTFATWEAARKALVKVAEDQAKAAAPEAEAEESEGEESGNGGEAGAETLASAAAAIGNAAIEAALRLDVDITVLLTAVVDHVATMTAAADKVAA